MDDVDKFWKSISAEQQDSLLSLSLDDLRARAKSLDLQSKGSGKTALPLHPHIPPATSYCCFVTGLCCTCKSALPHLETAAWSVSNCVYEKLQK